MEPDRVLVVSHGHPDLSKGGAEKVAHHLFKGLREKGVDALLLARVDLPAHPGAVFSTRDSEREILFHTKMQDFFLFRSLNIGHVRHDFAELVGRFRPQVVHFHHYVHMGLEMIRQTRLSCPDARIVLTLHEYHAICAQQGQMVRTKGYELCERASHADCARCIHEREPSDFFLRERYVKSFLRDVDLFISPSHFLKERYVDWGIDANRILVLENGQPDVTPAPPRPLEDGDRRGRLGFFGQITEFKGVDCLLEALALLDEEVRKQVHLDLHGANLEAQTEAFQKKIARLASRLRGLVRFHGPYASSRLGTLMAELDWVVVPSIWWENSPMVIQEAYSHGRPVIAADIGGMREKVEHEVTGLHFRARSPRALADTIERAVTDKKLYDGLCNSLPKPMTIEPWVAAHLDAYANFHTAISG